MESTWSSNFLQTRSQMQISDSKLVLGSTSKVSNEYELPMKKEEAKTSQEKLFPANKTMTNLFTGEQVLGQKAAKR